MTEFLRPLLYQAKSLLNDTLHCKASDVIGKAMMCSCGSPDEAVVIWTRQILSLIPVRQEVIAEDKEANDHS